MYNIIINIEGILIFNFFFRGKPVTSLRNSKFILFLLNIALQHL